MNTSIEAQSIFYLLCSILSHESNITCLKDIDWNKMYELSAYHKVDNMMAYVIEQLSSSQLKYSNLKQEVQEKFRNAKYAGIMREAIQQNELEKMELQFEMNHIDYLLLKGSILKQYYPSQDMRFLTDIDLLAKEKDRSFIQKVLKSQGYQFYHGSDHHDVYLKKPCMTIEVHWNCHTGYKNLDEYMNDVWERSELVKGNHHYQMKLEDFYLFQMGHFARHFENGGVGFRMLLDFLIYNQSLSQQCNQTIIDEQLKKAGLTTLETKVNQLIEKGMKQISLDDDLVWNYIVNAGAYAVYEFWAQNELGKSQNTFNYLIKRIFQPKEIMIEYYPWLKKYPYFIGVGWILRFFDKVILKPSRLKKEINILKNKQQRQNVTAVMKAMKIGDRNE